jgi:glycosyltransferase involved in cell wall biosynthesis
MRDIMKKKNLLFVIPSLSAGGGEKSLVNLLTQIDYDSYNVDLFLFNHDGLFMGFLPKQVKVLPIPEMYKSFTLPLFKSIKKLFRHGEIHLIYNRLLYTYKNRTIKNVSAKEQYTWRYLQKSLEKLEKRYDASIGFLEKTSTYFCIDKVNAIKKIGWIHTDYDKLGMNPKFDLPYFKQLTKIVTVSEECANIFINRFPDQKNKVEVVYNIVSPKMIYKMAEQEQRNVYIKEQEETIILTIGRLHIHKGLELAIETCKELLKRGYKIKWYVIGEGEEREKLTNLIKENELDDKFFLLGLKANPYPYIKQSDIYVQPSRFEGKSIAIDEAKILKKPIVVTNYSTAKDQIEDGRYGLIVEMNSKAITSGIARLIDDLNFKDQIIQNLSKLELGTEKEIEKLYYFI